MMSMIQILLFAILLLVAVNGQSSESSASSEESSEEKSNQSMSSEESSEEVQRRNKTKTMVKPQNYGYTIEKQNLIELEDIEQWNGHFNFKTSEVEVGTPCAGSHGECKHWCLTTQRKVTNDCGEHKFCCIMEH
ncbi:unnamed protein product [Diamesa serratosioi]